MPKTNQNRTKLYITDLSGEKRHVGDFDENDLTWYIERKYSRHFMHKMKAWGLDHETFRELVCKGLRKVVIYEREEKKHYTADRKVIEEMATFYQFGLNKLQIFLREDLWVKS